MKTLLDTMGQIFHKRGDTLGKNLLLACTASEEPDRYDICVTPGLTVKPREDQDLRMFRRRFFQQVQKMTIVGHSFHLDDDLEPVGDGTIHNYEAMKAVSQTEKSASNLAVEMHCPKELNDETAAGLGEAQGRHVH